MSRADHNRERGKDQFDAALRRAMNRPASASPDCPPPDLLAAYYDRAVSPAERERLDAHFAGCAHCQMQLAAIARADGSELAASPAPRFSWARRWRLAIPVVAAAAVVLIIVRAMQPAPSDRNEILARADKSRVSAEAPAPVAPASAPAAESQLAMNEPKPLTPPIASGSSAVEKREALNDLAATRMKKELKEKAQPAFAAAPSSPPKSSESAKLDTAVAQSEMSPAARDEIAGGAPSTQTQAAPSRAVGSGSSIAGAVGGAFALRKDLYADAKSSALASASSPDGAASWIVGKNGMLLRRSAAGQLVREQSGVSSDLLAASAPSADVCWVAGRAGTILRTIDAEHWTRVSSPTTDDLSRIDAADAEQAIVTTAGGQSFATSDGGASWHPN